MTDDPSDNQNVIVVNFSDDANAHEAITTLKQRDAQGQLDLAAAAVVARDEDGQVEIKDDVADATYAGTVGGGLFGLLIGIIGGPLGTLIGGATGMLVGSLFDTHEDDDTESALSDVSKSIRAGRTALLAEVAEQSTEVVDTAVRTLCGEVLRRSVSDVEVEAAAAEKAQHKAKREARQAAARGAAFRSTRRRSARSSRSSRRSSISTRRQPPQRRSSPTVRAEAELSYAPRPWCLTRRTTRNTGHPSPLRQAWQGSKPRRRSGATRGPGDVGREFALEVRPPVGAVSG